MNKVIRKSGSLLTAAFSAALFFSCSEAEINPEKIKNNEENEKYRINTEYTVFSSEGRTAGTACAKYNELAGKYMENRISSTKKEADELFRSLSESEMEMPSWKCELWISDSTFTANKNIISVRFKTYSFQGGAHGMTMFKAYNFDMEKGRLLENEEIIDYSKADAINKALKAHFDNPEGCFSTEPTLDLVNCINITEDSVCFTFEHYVLGAYACGYAEITVPISEIAECILIR